MLTLVAFVGFAHAALYAFALPPWNLEDEQQHVDYVLTVRDTGLPPDIRQTTRPAIAASAIATHDRAHISAPPPPKGTPPGALGLEGRSYEGHQPPLYYVLMAPLVVPLDDHVLTAMYVLRVANAALVGALCALTAVLASLWVPYRKRNRAALIAGLLVATIPAVAEAGARASNDMLTAVFITSTAVAASYLLMKPNMQRAVVTGIVAAGAILTKSTGLVVFGLLLALILFSEVRRPAVIAVILTPPIAAAIAWAIVTHARFGVWSGDSAFLQVAQPFPSLSLGTAISETFRHAPFPYGEWGFPLLVPVVIACLLGAGIVLALLAPSSRVLAIGALLVASAIVIGSLDAIDRGLTTVTARLLVPGYPLLCACAACGYVMLRRAFWARLAVTLSVILGTTFFLGTFLPSYPFRVG